MRHGTADIRAAAQGRWPEIHVALGIPTHLLNTRRHQPCPHCGGKDRYRYTDHKHGGGYICNQCTPEGGSGFDLLMLVFGYSFAESVKQVSAVLGLSDGKAGQYSPLPAKQPEQPPEDKQAALLAVWNEALPLDGKDPASLYLRTRGLRLTGGLPGAIRYTEGLVDYWYRGQDGGAHILGRFTAMLAVIAYNGQMQGLHITYLQQKGGVWRKLTASHPDTDEALPAKKMKARYAGALNGAAVHLGTPDGQGRLLVAEGIESALAGMEMFGLPAAAALSANGMERFRWLPETRELYIAADNDPSRTGIKAAETLARRAVLAGLTAKIWQSAALGYDVLDEWKWRQEKSRPEQDGNKKL